MQILRNPQEISHLLSDPSLRPIVLDTETTGISPQKGHRIVEIGAVKVNPFSQVEEQFHVYLNPERLVDPGAFRVHQLSDDFLSTQQKFVDVAQDFLQFIQGHPLVIHNAPFDLGFLNHELHLLGAPPLQGITIDTLAMAREKGLGKVNLDALCQRYGVDNTKRVAHGALLDAELLAEVFLHLREGAQASLRFAQNQPHPAQDRAYMLSGTQSQAGEAKSASIKQKTKQKIAVVSASEVERHEHEALLRRLFHKDKE